AETIDGGAHRIHHATEVAVADGHGQDLAGAADLPALIDAGELAEDDDAHLAELEVQGQAQGAVLEADPLVCHAGWQARDPVDAVGCLGAVADLLTTGVAGLVGGHRGFQCVPDLLRADRELGHRCSSRPLGLPVSGSACSVLGTPGRRAVQATSCSRARLSRASTVAS